MYAIEISKRIFLKLKLLCLYAEKSSSQSLLKGNILVLLGKRMKDNVLGSNLLMQLKNLKIFIFSHTLEHSPSYRKMCKDDYLRIVWIKIQYSQKFQQQCLLKLLHVYQYSTDSLSRVQQKVLETVKNIQFIIVKNQNKYKVKYIVKFQAKTIVFKCLKNRQEIYQKVLNDCV